jgi:secreted protein with Ig-like and vWFA domain
MKNPTGSLEYEFGGESHEMRLTMRGIARLQAKHGRTLAGVLDGTVGDIPDMAVVLDIISESLQRAGMDAAKADDLADEIATADPAIIGSILQTAFPDTEGNGKAKAKAKA